MGKYIYKWSNWKYIPVQLHDKNVKDEIIKIKYMTQPQKSGSANLKIDGVLYDPSTEKPRCEKEIFEQGIRDYESEIDSKVDF